MCTAKMRADDVLQASSADNVIQSAEASTSRPAHISPHPLWIAAPMVRFDSCASDSPWFLDGCADLQNQIAEVFRLLANQSIGHTVKGLPFRKLVRRHGVHLAYTPMIIAESFVASDNCRHAEFSTDGDDAPLIVQFAANNGVVMSQAAELVASVAQGIDLNCGCPQKWAMQEGYGSAMIRHPELVADMVSQTRSRLADLPDSGRDFTVSIKIRLRDRLSDTVSLCQQAESAGVSYITVHGRTPKQRNEPVDEEAIKTLKESLRIPLYANGDVCSREQALRVVERTGVDGVMVARGLLANPAMFDADAGDHCTLDTVWEWLDLAIRHGLPFGLWHHQLQYMLDAHLAKCQRRTFNRLTNAATVIDFLDENYGPSPAF